MMRFGEKMNRRLKKAGEERERLNHCLDELIRQMDLPGGGSELDSPSRDMDSSMNESFSEAAQDSPTTKLCHSMSQSIRDSARSQRHLTKVVMKVLSMDGGVAGRLCQISGTSIGSEAAATLCAKVGQEASPTSVASITSQPPLVELPLLVAAKAGPQLFQPFDLADFREGALGQMDSLVKNLPATQCPPATSQPEEEADGPLPRKSGAEDMVVQPLNGSTPPLKSKLLAEEDQFLEDIPGRNSTISDVEPAREPQPLGQSPRDATEELNMSTETPNLESPGAATSSFEARPSASGPEHEENLVTEADSSLSSSGLATESSANIEDAHADYSCIRPYEDGMDRACTMLHVIEQGVMKRELYIQVPEGIGPDRKVTFNFENQSHEVAVPDSYEVGQQVHITLSQRPFLERTAAQGLRRGHQQPDFPDRWAIVDNLRHSLRTDVDNSTLASEEFTNRYNWYLMLRGRSGAPLLPFTEEERSELMDTEDEILTGF